MNLKQITNMNKEFIPYEQALALKELGFDEECISFYNQDDENKLGIHAQFDTYNISASKNSTKIKSSRGNNILNLVSAPLYQQAFRWFREKYGLDSNTINTNMWNTFSFVINDIPNKNPITTYLDFNTHEEAELECLKKLIEIVKQNNNE